MTAESDPVRDIVYDVLGQAAESTIQEGFARGDGAAVTDSIASECRRRVLELPGDADKNVGAMITVLLHYLFSRLLVPTHRKVAMDGVHIDIVIPDARTLETNWNSAVVLCILTSTRPEYVEQRVSDAGKIQPNLDNIWIVSPGPVETGHRAFVIGPGGDSLADIVAQAEGFLEGGRSARFRIFKAV